jgi:RNA polymerase sigma-70 factor (ECF subfamily)
MSEPSATYEALVARLSSGDERALEALYHALHQPLWRFAYRFVHAHDVADDLVQDAFVTLWERRAERVITRNVRNYLFGVVRHRAIDLARHDTMARAVGAGVDGTGIPLGTGVPPISADQAFDEAAVQMALTAALVRLPEARRTALVLRWEHEMSYDDIAAVTGTTPAAARQLVSRARETIRGELAAYFED